MSITLNGTTGITTPADTVTTITSPAATALTIQSAGTTAMTIDTSQNVGIGTTTPASFGTFAVRAPGGGSCINMVGRVSDGYARFQSWDRSGTTATGSLVFFEDGSIAFNRSNTGTLVQNAVIDSTGNLLVGTTTGGAGKIRALNTANSYAGGGLCTINTVGNYWGVLCASTDDLYFGRNAVDKAYISASTGAYTAVSDMTLKKDIEDISFGLNAINALRPVQYRMLEDAEDAQKHLGFLAQEVEPIIPSSVSVMQGGKFGMDKSEVIPVLVKAIQELSAKNDALEARLAALETK